MSHKRATDDHAVDLPQFSKTYRRQGMLIVARCYAIEDHGGGRFEIVLWGNGNRGVVDVPAWEREQLEQRIDAAAALFSRCIFLRHRQRDDQPP